MKTIPDNAMLVDIQHVKENKKEGTPEMLYIIWKDIDTKKKYLITIENPTINIYFEKAEKRNHSYPKTYVYKTDCNQVNVRYSDIINAIINDGGEITKSRAKSIYSSRNYSQLNEFLKYPYVYGADIDIRAYYRYLWQKQHKINDAVPLSIGFMDIETDIFDAKEYPDPKVSPIDLVTVVDGDSRKSYTFSLIGRTYKLPDRGNMSDSEWNMCVEKYNAYKIRNQQENELIDDLDGLNKELHSLFDETYGNLEYKFFFYKDEAKMLIHLFELIHKINFDFLAFWNFEFDVNYIYDRAEYLGIDPRKLFCNEDFKVKKCYFKRDNFHFAIKNKTDYFYTTAYTNYICQMRIYAATRKNRSELRSNSLNYIGKKEVGDEKIDYSESGSLKQLAYSNYRKYFIYNIKDVLLQFGIENHTHDITNYYITSIKTITPLDSVFKQIIKLRCTQYMFYLDSGKVPGMNINKTPFNDSSEKDEDDDNGIEGALVGNGLLNSNTGMPLYGNKKTNNFYKYGIDMDMRAFYPSTIKITNNEQSNLIFKCHVDASQFNILDGDKPIDTISHIPLLPKEESDFSGDVAKECFDNFYTEDWLTAGHKWFNLPSIDELYEEVLSEMED